MSYHVMSCHVMSCHVMSCHVMSCHVNSRLLTSCHALTYQVMSRVMSRLVRSCHCMSSCSRILLPNLSSEPSKFFYYGGGVAPTRFSKPWPCAGIRLGATLSRCGAACTASVCVWRRAHFWDLGIVLRGRLPGSGVPRACRGHAAGMPRRCAVGIGFRARFVHAWPTCVSRGRLRGSCVLGGVSRVCRGCVAGALPWGLGSGRVARARDFTRCDLRFAWQVWDFGCIDALGKALDGGSAWQAQ